MKIILMSMPDVAPVMMHENAFHLPNCGIASIGANIDANHKVFIIDLIRKRRRLKKYVTQTILKTRPDLVGLSVMAWQYGTCIKLIQLIKQILPSVKILIGGYHPTLMYDDIAVSAESEYIDFMIRGEGEEACRRLVNALDGKDSVEEIASLSYKRDHQFVHNSPGELLDLSRLKLPIRDKRRLTWGYHIMNSKVEVMETSRGCTRACTYCSMKQMYGQSFRPFPLERILADLDVINNHRNTRWVFIADDNLVLDPNRVVEICQEIMARNYKKLNMVIQADSVSMAKNEEMVRNMSLAGIKTVFLGIENVSKKNLAMARKGNIVDASRKAVENCHKYGIMVIGGLIFGFPDDDEQAIIDNYQYFKSTGADTAYCQILTPYPKTEIRQHLLDEGLVTNIDDYKRYNGLWANVKTKYLESDQLQYLFWYHRQNVLGWWEPSEHIRSQSLLWTSIWIYAFRPMMKFFIGRKLKKHGWKGRYELEMKRQAGRNVFKGL